MRRLFSGLLALMLVVGSAGSLATRARAASEYMEYDAFLIYKGYGATVSNTFAKKWDSVCADMVTAVFKSPETSINWLSSERVYWRGRSDTLAKATELGETYVEVENYPLAYLSGYGTRLSEYTIAAQYDDSNPYTKLELWIYWDP